MADQPLTSVDIVPPSMRPTFDAAVQRGDWILLNVHIRLDAAGNVVYGQSSIYIHASSSPSER